MDMVFLTPKEIVEKYGLPKSVVYELLRIKTNPCPKVKGGKGKHYLVLQSAWEKWLEGRHG